MEEYQNNSHAYKDQQKTEIIEKPKQIQKVASGKTKKKGEMQKLIDAFIAEDLTSIKNDILIPAIKKTIDDMISEGIHRLLYPGDTSGISRRTNASRVSYRSYYDRPEIRPAKDNRAATVFDYDEIVFDTRGDAEAVLSQMEEIINHYQVCSVADLYDMANISNPPYTSVKYGWTSVRTATVVRARGGGYVIKLPRAIPID